MHCLVFHSSLESLLSNSGRESVGEDAGHGVGSRPTPVPSLCWEFWSGSGMVNMLVCAAREVALLGLGSSRSDSLDMLQLVAQ